MPEDGILTHLRYASLGAHAVAGLTEIHDWSRHDEHTRQRYDALVNSQIHNGRHEQVYGANLGVRADVYHRVGGFRPLHSGEDRDLWQTAEQPLSEGAPPEGSHSEVTSRPLWARSSSCRGRLPAGSAAILVSRNGVRRPIVSTSTLKLPRRSAAPVGDGAEEIAHAPSTSSARSGDADQQSKTSTKDIPAPRRGGIRSGNRYGPGGRTKAQLYADAKAQDIRGRSKMTKAQLEPHLARS